MYGEDKHKMAARSLAFSASFSASSDFVKAGSHLRCHNMKSIKYFLSLAVYLFPLVPGTISVGGVGEREGGGGTFISACGGGKWASKTGV